MLILYYLMTGVAISVPFCLLAGWEWVNAALVAVSAPALLLPWLIMGKHAGLFQEKLLRKVGISKYMTDRPLLWNKDSPKASRIVFLYYTLALLSPILAHWSSPAFSGYPEIAAALETYRFSFPFFSAFPLVIIDFVDLIFGAVFFFALSVFDLFDIFSALRKRS